MKISIFLLAGVFSITRVVGQGENKDQAITNQLPGDPINLYARTIRGDEPIINGRDYIFYNFKMEGNPYLDRGEFASGTLSYQGKIYDSVDLLYDISRNELVLSNRGRSIVLQNGWVDSFALRGHKFVSFDPETERGLPYSGYYDILYRGRLELVSYRECPGHDVIENGAPVRVFLPRDRYYVKRSGTYYSVNDRQDIFRLFGDKKRELKKFIRKNHMRMQPKEFEETLEKVTAFYDQSTD